LNEYITDVVKQRGLQWFGDMERKDTGVSAYKSFEVNELRDRG